LIATIMACGDFSLDAVVELREGGGPNRRLTENDPPVVELFNRMVGKSRMIKPSRRRFFGLLASASVAAPAAMVSARPCPFMMSSREFRQLMEGDSRRLFEMRGAMYADAVDFELMRDDRPTGQIYRLRRGKFFELEPNERLARVCHKKFPSGSLSC
jgi:hypothetical protein